MDLGHLPEDLVRALVASVVRQALVDLKASDIILALDAALWITGPDGALWLEALDMPAANATNLLASGRLLQSGRLIHARAKETSGHER